jgi:hypothetical protein
MTRTAILTASLKTLAPALIGASLLLGPAAFAQSGDAAVPNPAAQNDPAAKQDAAPPLDMTKEWPCVQRKVETLSPTAIWDGPPIDGVKGWFREKDISDLINLISSRRVPVEEAEAKIKEFAAAQPEDQRDAKLVLLFAGLFDKIASQRRVVMSGIVKYQKSQIERAKELERQSSDIGALESKRPPGITEDTPELAQAREKFNWAQRIFQERQSNIPLACELPVLIEERLYALSRAIRGEMKS